MTRRRDSEGGTTTLNLNFDSEIGGRAQLRLRVGLSSATIPVPVLAKLDEKP